ncbi:hypothetical protein BCR32DRAFT_325016 [Anaeromyces robustus]|uniref:Uncharacterized protein n=1 Tax=Anaeromyces robustus TaxID=1754192 RepID=A0A1Y1XLI7_9FUNG|nr:hypothetical protein BCR32DRAFT_325016 [Anaeromyces robustus]|eukprot:ORX86366.1 hypothetical protein BCR32DRAFT_325016 [Anaeromyces robustus]
MVYLYRKELNHNREAAVIYDNQKDFMNISTHDSVDITVNQNNFKALPVIPVTTTIENDSLNDFTMYNSCNSKTYNKRFVSINSEDNILSSKKTFDTSSNINDYLSHSYSYSDKGKKNQYHHRKNNSYMTGSQKRFPSIKKPRNIYERQSSISSTIGSVKSIIKRRYSIRSKSHSRNHSTSNSKIPSILIQNNIPLHFINEELDSKTSSLNEYCQSVNSSVTDNNVQKPKLNYLSSSSSKIKYDEDLPITDILIPSSSYSYSSKTMLCNNSYDYNNIFTDGRNDDFNSVNNNELNRMYKENFQSNRNYPMMYSNKKPESIYSLSSYSDYSDNISYVSDNVEDEKKENSINNNNQSINESEKPNIEKLNMNTLDISSLNFEYKREE